MAKTPRRPRSTTPSSPANRMLRLTSDEVERRLARPGDDPELREYLGPEVYGDLKGRLRGANSRRMRALTRTAAPRVLILPGIMGSTIGRPRLGWDAIWLNPEAIGQGQLSKLSLNRPPGTTDVRAIDVLPMYYTALRVRLRDVGMNADFFAYDWRLSVMDLAKLLEAQLAKESAASISLVAHSMGGLVCRAAVKLNGPGIRKVKRIVMLGTPNFGSFVPAQVLNVQYPFVNNVIAMDVTQSSSTLTREVFSTFPSLYQMLPSSEKYSLPDLFNPASWPKTLPRLDESLLAKSRLVQAGLPTKDDRFRLIAGVDQETVTSVQKNADGRFEFFSTSSGDGTVPLALAKLSDDQTWYVSETHGGLPRNLQVSEAVIELLQSADGTTSVLPKTWQATRGFEIPRRVEVPPLPFGGRDLRSLKREDHQWLMESVYGPLPPRHLDVPSPAAIAVSPGREAAPQETSPTQFDGVLVGRRKRRLEIVLAKGSIADVPAGAHVLGVFEGVTPSGAARAVDERSNGLVRDFHTRHMIEGGLGKVSLIPTNCTALPTDLIAFIGLGPFGDFKPERQKLGAAAVVRALVRLRINDFVTVLIGESFSAGQANTGCVPKALEMLLEGFLTGLRDSDPEHLLQRIVFAVMDDAKYQQLKTDFYSMAATRMFDDIELVFAEMKVPSPFQEQQRDHRTAANSLPGESDIPNYLVVNDYASTDKELRMRLSFLTASGRGSLPSQIASVERKKLDALLERFDPDVELRSPEALKKLSGELSRLLLPEAFVKALGEANLNQRSLRLVHDSLTSKIPWEALSIGDSYPALEPGLSRHFVGDDAVRKLSGDRAADDMLDVLMVVNPTEDLSGAEIEGKSISNLLGQLPGIRIVARVGSQATREQILDDLQSGQFDIVHYAGHAAFDPHDPKRRGLYCAGGRFLTGADLADLTMLPTLVFLNACQSGRIRRVRGGRAPNKPTGELQSQLKQTVSVAEAFLRGGLKLFLGTYWPVGDDSAKVFSEEFYRNIVTQKSVGQAVHLARHAIVADNGYDWADYMLYGDPRFPIKQPR